MMRWKWFEKYKWLLVPCFAILGFVWLVHYNIYPRVPAGSIDSVSNAGEIAQAVLWICTSLVIVTIVLISLCYRKRAKIENLFLATAIPLLLVFMLLTPIGAISDSSDHVLAAYRFSGGILGIQGEEVWIGRPCDVQYFEDMFGDDRLLPTTENITRSLSGLMDGKKETELVAFSLHPDEMLDYSVICYLPQALGILIGRSLSLSPSLTFLLGRLCIMAFYIFGCYHAIKRMPWGKSVLALAALLPESMIIGASYSYDAVTLVVCLNFIASVFAVRERVANEKKILCWLELGVVIFLLGAVKAGGYLLLLPLVFCLIDKQNKKTILWVIILWAVGGFSCFLFDVILAKTPGLAQLGTEDSWGYLNSGFALQHPVKYLKMLATTYVKFPDRIFLASLGKSSLWWEDVFPETYLFAFLMSFVPFMKSEKRVKLERKTKIAMILAVAMVVVVVPAMILKETLAGTHFVEGINGRYYLPVFPIIILLVLGSRKDSVEDCAQGREKGYTSFPWLAIVYVLLIYSMMEKYLTR